MKIFLIIHSLGIGGMERVMTLLANYLSSLPHVTVYLILIGREKDIQYELSDKVIVCRPDFTFDNSKRKRLVIKTMFFLRKKVKEIDPFTILSFGEIWNNLVLLTLMNIGYPIFVSDRCKPNKSLGRFHNLLRKWLYPKAGGIIAQTSKAKEVYEKQQLNKNIRVIENPIYHVTTNGQTSKENIVLTVGRLIESKHHNRLIKIFKNISSSGWKLVIVGGDALKQSGMKGLKKLIRELNMEDTVEITGTVTDIESYYRKSKIFAFTSSSEGFPNVIGEAMSAGLPIIAYDCMAGPSDMIDDGENGFLIPLFNDDLFTEKLDELINKDDLRVKMGNESRDKIQKFSIENIGRKYHTFITKGL